MDFLERNHQTQLVPFSLSLKKGSPLVKVPETSDVDRSGPGDSLVRSSAPWREGTGMQRTQVPEKRGRTISRRLFFPGDLPIRGLASDFILPLSHEDTVGSETARERPPRLPNESAFRLRSPGPE